MISHKLRVQILGFAALVLMIALVVMDLLGETEGTLFGMLVGFFLSAMGGFFDSLKVEGRRRNPRIPAIVDDVREDPELEAARVTVRGNGVP